MLQYRCESQELHGHFKVMESNTGMIIVSMYKSTFIRLLLFHSTTESCVGHCLHFLTKVFYNSPLAGCFYTTSPTGSCVHAFLTDAVAVGIVNSS